MKAAPDGSLVGALAAEWDVSSDQKTYTFTLREAFFTAAARLLRKTWSTPLIEAEPGDSIPLERLCPGRDIEGEGNTVVIRLSQPNAAFLYTLAEVNGDHPAEAEGLSSQPVGTGPYKLAEWRPNNFIRLERFDQHWSGQVPYYDQVVFRIIPDQHSAVLNLLSGTVDLIPRMEASVYHQVASIPRIKVVSAPMNLVQILAVSNQGRHLTT